MIMRKILLFAVVFSTMLFPREECFGETRFGNVTVLGDSIASGYGLPDYTSGNNYSAPLSWGNLLGEESSRYENFALDGRTSDELLATLEQPTDALKNSLDSADCVVVSIGGNDFLGRMMYAVKYAALTDTKMISALLNGEFRTEMLGELTDRLLKAVVAEMKNADLDKTVSNIREVTEKIGQLNPDARIVLLTIYDPFSEHILLSGISDAVESVLSELNGKISEIADSSPKVKIADVHAAFAGNASRFTNINRLDVHPSEAGHERIYELLCDIIAA